MGLTARLSSCPGGRVGLSFKLVACLVRCVDPYLQRLLSSIGKIGGFRAPSQLGRPMSDQLHKTLLCIAAALALLPPSLRAATTESTASLTVYPEQFDLAGMNEGRQLVVSAGGAERRVHDLTSEALYTVAPPGVVRVGSQ